MDGRVALRSALGLVCVLVCPRVANAQATGQMWGNLIGDWLATERLTSEVDFEPRTQRVVSDGQPIWNSIDVIPRVEYTVSKWIDVLGEVDIGRQNQNNAVDTTTVAPRIGAELHL